MQRRQLWVLNFVLAAAAILMGLRVAADWKRGNERYATLRERAVLVGSIPVTSGSVAQPAVGGEIVARNLFSPDRNNDRPQAPAQVAGPLPVVIGTLRLGSGYEALMAEAGATGVGHFRRVKIGEQVGGYTVAEIRDEAVVVEFQGKKTVVNVYQSAQSVRQAAATTAPPPSPLQTAPVVESAGSQPAPSQPTAPAARPTPAVSPAGVDLTPPFPGVTVTIEGNRKRFERPTAFGPQVWYEDIKK